MAVIRGCIFSLLAVCACGRVGYEELASPDDAAVDIVDARVEVDAALGPFGSGAAVPSLASSSVDDDPTLSADMLEIYFASKRAGGTGGEDLWFATRATLDDAFGPPQAATELNSNVADTAPELSADGLTITFGSDRAGGLGARDIWISTRPSRASPWAAPTNVLGLSTVDDETAPSMDAATLRVIINKGSDLYEARRASSDVAWEPALSLDELNTAEPETAPNLSANGLVLYFSAGRDGEPLDIYRTERASLDAPFMQPELVEGPNTTSLETDPWVSADGRVMYFTTDRDGNQEIYATSR